MQIMVPVSLLAGNRWPFKKSLIKNNLNTKMWMGLHEVDKG